MEKLIKSILFTKSFIFDFFEEKLLLVSVRRLMLKPVLLGSRAQGLLSSMWPNAAAVGSDKFIGKMSFLSLYLHPADVLLGWPSIETQSSSIINNQR